MALGELATCKDSKGIFRFNPGKEEKCVPDYNPYTIRKCNDCDIAKDKLKCPDLRINGLWYEHEGFITDNPKRAFANMMAHGLKQSNRIIIDHPGLTERYIKRSICNRINYGEDIEEV